MRTRRALALAAIALPVALPATAALASTPNAVVNDCTHARQHPATLTVDCHHHITVSGIRWTSFGGGMAAGTGRLKGATVSVKLESAHSGIYRQAIVTYGRNQPAGTVKTTHYKMNTPPPPAPPAPQFVQLASSMGSGIEDETADFSTSQDGIVIGFTYDCTNFGTSGDFSVAVYHADGTIDDIALDRSGDDEGSAVEFHLDNPGSYYLSIDSECDWTVNVQGYA